MRLDGRIWRDGRFWLAEVPLLDAMTQGRSEREAYRMIADLIETMANKRGFAVSVHPAGRHRFEIESSDVGTLVAVMLRRLREKQGLPLSELAKRLGSSSKTAYARYEQGKAVPTVTKLFELLAAVAPGIEFAIDQRGGPHKRAA